MYSFIFSSCHWFSYPPIFHISRNYQEHPNQTSQNTSSNVFQVFKTMNMFRVFGPTNMFRVRAAPKAPCRMFTITEHKVAEKFVRRNIGGGKLQNTENAFIVLGRGEVCLYIYIYIYTLCIYTLCIYVYIYIYILAWT